jgi:N-acetylneuraminic acid mutarotase
MASAVLSTSTTRRVLGEDALVWTEGVPIPLARSELAAAEINGSIYVCCGFGGGERVDRFDTATRQWSRVADLPVAVHHPGVAALDGTLYVAGGYRTDDQLATAGLWAYDPGQDTWNQRAELPAPKGAFGLVALDGALYAVGGAFGHRGGPVSGDTLRYDPLADSWSELRPMPTPREHLAVVATDGSIYTVGGRANGDVCDTFAAAVEAYDLAADVWTARAPLPVPRGGLSGTAAGESVVVLGGERGTTTFADANRYDPNTDFWTALPPMPTARHGLASAFVAGELYAITGSLVAGDIDNTDAVDILRLESAATPTA